MMLTALLAAVIAFAANDAPQFNDKNELLFPDDYREWIHLSSGLGMTYGPAAAAALNNPSFDNVYVHPTAWKAFKESGHWPEGTIFVLEVRFSSSHGSINKAGFFQSDIAAVEAAVKDSRRFPRAWAYFGFAGGLRPARQSASAFPLSAGCNACHEANGAVENSFTQFYPIALEIARKKGVLKASFQLPGPESSPSRLMHALSGLGKKEALAMLEAAKAADPSAAAFKEGSLNQIGHALLQNNDKPSAIAVFEWTAQAFPTSSNAADSLAEAYEADHQIDAARSATERALKLLDTDTSVTDEKKPALRKALNERLARLGAK
jgi:tetratricopeptide (TPR) repeat protein